MSFFIQQIVFKIHLSCVYQWLAHLYCWAEIYLFLQWLFTDLDFGSGMVSLAKEVKENLSIYP